MSRTDPVDPLMEPPAGRLPPEGPWVLRPRPSPYARVRLLCLPHAGGGPSIFRPWLPHLPLDLELCLVQLPGREGRLHEPSLTALPALVQALASHVRPYLDRPFALYGHSMGALVAFELARELRRQGAATPARLFLAAAPAPHLPSGLPPMHKLPELALVAAVQRRYGAMPDEVARDAELRRLLLPALRADLTVLETYEYRDEAPLATPLSVLGGLDDASVGREQLEAWGDQAAGQCVVRMVPGDHLFLRSARAFVLAAIEQDLAPFLGQAQTRCR